ncbi:MAG: tRNA threonylcarbamoyladenosine dehydratase [Clostridia bacterium]|nr:tRNA threonylcarbamoyladenosine dehydratase [Clostridia bacterium]
MLTESRFDRTRALLSDKAVETLSQKSVLVAGLGGVGSWAAEALARAGVGRLILIDGDVVTPSNLNRQLFALESTVGLPKCQVARCRLYDINSRLIVDTMDEPLLAGEIGDVLRRFAPIDYVIDAIDSLSAKIDLIATAEALGIPIIVSMGTGNRLDPTRLKIADLSETHTDPLARIVRRELRKRDIEHVKVVFSEEPPVTPIGVENRTIGSVPFVPPVAGFLLASEVIRDLTSFPAEK